MTEVPPVERSDRLVAVAYILAVLAAYGVVGLMALGLAGWIA